MKFTKILSAGILSVCAFVFQADAEKTAGSYPVPYPQDKTSAGKIAVNEKLETGPDGIYNHDRKLLIPSKPGGKISFVSDNEILAQMYFVCATAFKYWCATYHGGKHSFQDVKVSCQDGQFTYTGKIPLNKDKTVFADYSQTIELEKDGKVKFTISTKVPEGVDVFSADSQIKKSKSEAFYKPHGFRMDLPFALYAGTQYQVNGKIFSFSNNAKDKLNKMFRSGITLVFFPGTKKEYAIIMTKGASIGLTGNSNGFSIYLRPDAKTQQLEFYLDFRKYSESPASSKKKSYAGIDFWKDDRLIVPNYTQTSNMLSNPSFESGLRYYNFYCDIGWYNPGDENAYSIDNNEKKFGASSLRINVGAKGKLQSFAYPIKPDTFYTLSCYAKANRDNMFLSIDNTGFPGGVAKPGAHGWTLSRDWKRYSFTFKTLSEKGYCFYLYAKNKSGSREGSAWVDGLQLEEGKKATPYVEPAAYAFLKTSNPDNFLTPDEKIDAKLIIKSAKPETTGVVEVKLKDFFYNETKLGSFKFTTNANGKADIPLPLDKCLKGKLGVFVLKTDIKLNDKVWSDFFRFSIMNKMKGTHKHKGIFSFRKTVNPRYEALLERWRDIGLGSTNYYYYNFHQKNLFDLLKKYNIEFTGRQIKMQHAPQEAGGSVAIEPNGMSFSRKYRPGDKVLVEGFSEWKKMTPEREKLIEDAAYEYAKYYHWIDKWFFEGECALKFRMLKDGNVDDFVRLMIAAAKGFRKAGNKAFMTGGPSSITGGLKETDGYLSAVERVEPGFKFDMIAVHPYNALPESPDYDDCTRDFLTMLKKHGYEDVPVYFNEGGCYSRYSIPEWKATPYHALANNNWLSSPSYDMGWGERVSSAFNARGWLAALKYADRVKQFNQWVAWIYLDYYFAPMAVQKIVNTLARLLGNADFKEDIRFAPNSRSYVFEDENKCPVAVIWGYDQLVDRGKKKPPVVKLDFPEGRVPEVIDLMENICLPSGDGKSVELTLGPFPMFLKGKPGDLPLIVKALKNASVSGPDSCPLRITSRVLDKTDMAVIMENPFSKAVVGKLDLTLKGKKEEINLNLASRQKLKLKVKMPEPVSADKISETTIPYSFTIKKDTYKGSFDCRAFAIKHAPTGLKIDGSLDDWKNIPFIKIRNRNSNIGKRAGDVGGGGFVTGKVGYPGDFEAEFKTAWDDAFLYLAVKVYDDEFVCKKHKFGPAGRWYNDSIQLYIDTWGNGRDKSNKRFDDDDYYYEFFAEVETGTALAYRRLAPDMQIAGGLDAPKPGVFDSTIKTAFKLTKDGYIYEIAIPKDVLFPLNLKRGTVFGFGMYLNDRDGKFVKSALTLTPSDTGCYQRPDLWPSALLVE